MAKNINKFVKEVLEYIDANIIGTENTHIVGHGSNDIVTNRGHAIQATIEVPDDLKENLKTVSPDLSMGPVFYAEELLSQMPSCTPAAAAEHINQEINQDYENMITVLKSQAAVMNKTIEDYDPSELFITALPSSGNMNMDTDNFITKDLKDLGLVVSMKGLMCKNPSCPGQSYFTPIQKKTGRDANADEWNRAAVNSMQQAEIRIECIPSPMLSKDGIPIPLCGFISDQKQFYDWFYMVSPEHVWKVIAERHHIDTILIIPGDAASALFSFVSEETAASEEARKMQEKFLEEAIKTARPDVMPCYIDCKTWEVAPLVEHQKTE